MRKQLVQIAQPRVSFIRVHGDLARRSGGLLPVHDGCDPCKSCMIEADAVSRPAFLAERQGDINRRRGAGHGKTGSRAAFGGFNEHRVSSRCHGSCVLVARRAIRVLVCYGDLPALKSDIAPTMIDFMIECSLFVPIVKALGRCGILAGVSSSCSKALVPTWPVDRARARSQSTCCAVPRSNNCVKKYSLGHSGVRFCV